MIKRLITLLVVLSLGLSYEIDASSIQTHTGKLGRHNKAVYAAIKKKLNISNNDIRAAKENGITAFNLAYKKGVKEEELRSFIICEAEKSLEQVQANGLMPRFLVSRIKNKVRVSIENWDGYFN